MLDSRIVHSLAAALMLGLLSGCGGSDDETAPDLAAPPPGAGGGLPALDGSSPEAIQPAQNTGPIQTVEVDFSSAAPPEKQIGAVVESANAALFKEDGEAKAPTDAVSLLNRAIEVYGERRHETDDGDGPQWPVISDLNQLVRYRILRALPAPPPGKKFKLDPKTKVVSLE
jgi:hypothetical protein